MNKKHQAKLEILLDDAEQTILVSKKKIAHLKTQLSDRESELIEASLIKENLIEELRRHQDRTTSMENTDKKDEVADFRQRFPELCQMAKERDEVK